MAKPLLDSENRFVNSRLIRAFDRREFICGWASAFINIGITYPVYKMIFRQMLLGVSLKSAFKQLQTEGMPFLYRGIFPPLAQKTISLSLMFGVYDGTKRPLIEFYGVNPYISKILAGLISGSVESVLMPFERIQTVLADSTYHQNFKNSSHAVKVIWTEHGFKEFYRGLVPILLRNGPSNAAFFILREEATVMLPRQQNVVYQGGLEFFTGACIGAFVSSIFYPLNVLKVVMQCKLGGPNENMFKVFTNIYVERGSSLRNVYRGVTMNCTRAFFSWGIMNVAYENMRKIVY